MIQGICAQVFVGLLKWLENVESVEEWLIGFKIDVGQMKIWLKFRKCLLFSPFGIILGNIIYK